MQKLWIKISSLLFVALSLASQPFSYSTDSTLLAHGINGYAPGSKYAASDMEKNFSYEGIAAKNFNLFPEDGTQIQKIGFAVFQEILNHIRLRDAYGKLLRNNFTPLIIAGITSPNQDSLDKLNTQSIPLSLSLGPASGVPYSTVLSIGSMYPKLANTSTTEFTQTYAINIKSGLDFKKFNAIVSNISNYLSSTKAIHENENFDTAQKEFQIPLKYKIFPTKFFDLEIGFAPMTKKAVKNLKKLPGVYVFFLHRTIRVNNDLCTPDGVKTINPPLLNHPIFHKQG